MDTLRGKTAIITGASRGIGAATARHFAEAGANVVLLARTRPAIEEIAREIGSRALAISADTSRWPDMEAAVEKAARHFGKVDILINNAAVIEPIAPIEQTDPEAWSRAIDINLKGVYHGIRAVLPRMIVADGGTIITISSGAAHNPLEGWSAYCASKAGAAMLTACTDREGRGRGLRVMGLSPGTVATDMQKKIRKSGINPVSRLDWSEHIPPEWPARALLWMCTPDADEFLGQEISLRDPDIRRRMGLSDD